MQSHFIAQGAYCCLKFLASKFKAIERTSKWASYLSYRKLMHLIILSVGTFSPANLPMPDSLQEARPIRLRKTVRPSRQYPQLLFDTVLSNGETSGEKNDWDFSS